MIVRGLPHELGYGGTRRFFSSDLQRVFNLFVFFLAFPSLTFLDVSITFWIFLILAHKVRIQYGYIFKVKNVVDYLLLAFPFIALISLLMAPTLPGTTLFGDFKIWMQYVYWIVLSLFLISHGRHIQWQPALKYIFWGVNCLVFVFYLIGTSIDLVIFTIDLKIPRNAFLFQLLCLVPLALLFSYLRYGRKVFFACSLMYLYVGFLTQGRAGSILLFFEILILIIVVTKSSWYSFRLVLMPFLLLLIGFALVTVNNERINKFVADQVEPVNLRLANLIRGIEDGDLSEDDSWLTRQLMIAKAKEIFAKYPYFGVGISHFTKYKSELKALNDEQFRDFRNEPRAFLNSRSAHNSYFQILSEVGVFGFVTVCFIFLIILVRFFFIFFQKLNIQVFFSIGLTAILVHFFVISSITGAVTWFVVGVALFALSNNAFAEYKRNTAMVILKNEKKEANKAFSVLE